MFCPAGVNTGLIQLVGPIASTDLNSITVSRAPLMINFGPRSTPASLVGNRIDDTSNGTCTYNMNKFSLVDIQIVSPIHTGYNLPGHNESPRAELILSFSANSAPSSVSQLSGLLLCLPIYESSSTSHDIYIDQMVQNDATTASIASLESLFYSSSTDVSQTSFGYKTCFETQDAEGHVGSNSLFVNVYPNGVHLASGVYQSLFSMLGQALSSYQLPPGLRGGDATVRNYTIDDDGNKVATQIDGGGVIYTSPLSTCTDDFKNRFEYFSFPPQRVSSKVSKNTTRGTCPTVKQYKCMPFDQLRDNQGGYVQVSDGTCLDDIIQQGKPIPSSTDSSSDPNKAEKGYSVAEIEEIVASVIGGALGLVVLIWAVSKITKSE